MEEGSPDGTKRRGFSKRRLLALAALLFIPVVFLLGNLVLTSPWTRAWVCGKIERRTSLEARIASLTWSPWAGVSLGGFELLQPAALREAAGAPLVSVETLRLDPQWRSWIRGIPEIKGVEMDTPRIVLPVELLSHLAQTAQPPQPPAAPPPQPPALAANDAPPQDSPAPPASPTADAAPQPPAVSPPPVAAAPPATKPQPPAAPPVITTPTVWLKMNDASFRLVFAAKKQTLLSAENIHGGIPIAGRTAKSSLEIGAVKLLDTSVSEGFGANLDWTFPHLTLLPVEAVFHGCKTTFAARIASVNGLPIQAEWKMPPQKPEEIAVPFGGRATMDTAAAEGRFLGLLMAPASWQGAFAAEGIAPVVSIPSQTTRFDRARVQAILRGGILSCVDARLVGDDASFLGNATLLPDGRLAAAARVVASPQGATHVARTVFPALPGEPSLTPLSTPQRVAFDLEAIGNIGQLFLRLGKDGPVVEIKP